MTNKHVAECADLSIRESVPAIYHSFVKSLA